LVEGDIETRTRSMAARGGELFIQPHPKAPNLSTDKRKMKYAVRLISRAKSYRELQPEFPRSRWSAVRGGDWSSSERFTLIRMHTAWFEGSGGLPRCGRLPKRPRAEDGTPARVVFTGGATPVTWFAAWWLRQYTGTNLTALLLIVWWEDEARARRPGLIYPRSWSSGSCESRLRRSRMRRPLLQFVTQLEKIQLTPGAHGQRGVMRAARWKKEKGEE
jgi:hypothetical protein